ncbi:MAG: ribonuclease Z [Bacteroidota bacterium]|nr:ribonuclease Z [Bacteroidota bacterium]
MFSITILGNNSAVPAHHRHPTAQVLQTAEHTFLIDCGEGTQMQMNAYKIRRSKISHIFISHLHGDHYFGLIGLLTSLGLNHRTADLHIFSCEPLKEIIELQLGVAKANLPYQIHFHTLCREEVIFEDATIQVECFAVDHRITCWGFLFREKKNLRKINPEMADHYKVPSQSFEALHQGADYVTPGGETIPNEKLTIPASPPRSYAYCADTRYFEPIIDKVKGVNLLYHEATYLHEQEDKAFSRFHTTALQAGMIAHKAGVQKLILGHFSSMYEELQPFKAEASEVFPNVEIAAEGCCFFL